MKQYWRSFLKGMASIGEGMGSIGQGMASLFGTVSVREHYSLEYRINGKLVSPEEWDKHQIAKDWEAAGNDLRNAMKTMAEMEDRMKNMQEHIRKN